MMRFCSAVIVLTVALLTCSANAADKKKSVNLENAKMAEMPVDVYKKIGDLARANLKMAKINDTDLIGEETEEQLKDPLLKNPDRRRVIDRGFISIFAEWCGYDWQNRSFMPFMAHERNKGVWSDKQMAFFGMLHGVAMGVMQSKLKSEGACPDTMKKRVETFLAPQE